MHGPDILVRTISKPLPRGRLKVLWQYNRWSDHHSKVACWGIVFDLIHRSTLLRTHIENGKVGFGINHPMYDFKNNRDKDLDLVICTHGQGKRYEKYHSFLDMARTLQLELLPEEVGSFRQLPHLAVVPPGSVLIALEAKACMTEHVKAIPRLHDELNSSHLIAHGASDEVIAGGFTMINIAARFISPARNPKPFSKPVVWNYHKQPDAAERVIKMIADIPRRSKPGEVGYDAMTIVLIECLNDDVTPVYLKTEPPALELNTTFHYGSFIERLSSLYINRFKYL